MTVKELLKDTYSKLTAADSKIDCDIIMCHVLGIERSALFSHKTDILPEEKVSEFLSCIKRYEASEPVQYITGTAPFGSLLFKVTPDVLIPRFDTEILLETVIKYASGFGQNFNCLDLCTGSGCLAVSIAEILPKISVFASDISQRALKIASENCDRLTGSGKITFIESNLFDSDFFKSHPEFFDMIISNPPYIPTGDLSSLDDKVKNHEPIIALDGGIDGLDFYRKIIRGSREFLKHDGILMVEIGINQSEAVTEIFRECNYKKISVINDYGNIARVITGIK